MANIKLKNASGVETTYNNVTTIKIPLASGSGNQNFIIPTGNINITNTNSTNVTNYTTAQVVDANLVAGNIKKDINILGVTGTFEGGGSQTNGMYTAQCGGSWGCMTVSSYSARGTSSLLESKDLPNGTDIREKTARKFLETLGFSNVDSIQYIRITGGAWNTLYSCSSINGHFYNFTTYSNEPIYISVDQDAESLNFFVVGLYVSGSGSG